MMQQYFLSSFLLSIFHGHEKQPNISLPPPESYLVPYKVHRHDSRQLFSLQVFVAVVSNSLFCLYSCSCCYSSDDNDDGTATATDTDTVDAIITVVVDNFKVVL